MIAYYSNIFLLVLKSIAIGVFLIFYKILVDITGKFVDYLYYQQQKTYDNDRNFCIVSNNFMDIFYFKSLG